MRIGSLAPRSLLRPIRIAVMALVVSLLWFGFRDMQLLRLPGGEAALFDLPAGSRVLVEPFQPGRPPRPGDALVFRGREGALRIARLVARSGEPLELDRGGRRLRRKSGETWYPAPLRVFAGLPLAPGELLLLSENSRTRDWGEILAPHRNVLRVLAVLPF